ncbi:hypothetical protein PHACT_12655 [Pseudohongiella acticola]|uniref:Uncharacterized protein n=1 Tax=Pseudohongiella acticola TaxID=1524254 RepID=A0A1E8CG05_9GAMM|nr:hypothetical protein [Pseudohongiella acticola]OFE11401.1 hypothetical protein PHACT_12655 [Pseudohongiella acticola]
MTHDEIVQRAERFLQSMNCKVVIRDPFRAHTHTGEQPDAIGWRDGLSFLIEAKASRADFLADRKKKFRSAPETGMGDWRFYMCPPNVIMPEDLPAGWGLLWVHPRKVERVTGFPRNCHYHRGKPFQGNKVAENMMLVSALRRLTIRGYLPEIYQGPVGAEYGA